MQPEQSQPSSPSPVQPPEQSNQWRFVPENDYPNDVNPSPTTSLEVSWSASEFIAYQKSVGWYALVLLAIVAIAAIIFFITSGDILSTVSIFAIGVIFIIFASRKPRVLQYRIDTAGIAIGDKLYPFGTIKSFALINEGAMHSVALLPMRRFMPTINMYFEPQDEAKIVTALGGYLPQEERRQELVDKFMHKIRF